MTTKTLATLTTDSAARAGAAAALERVAVARRARCAGILAKMRRILTPEVMDDTTQDPIWDVLAATFALGRSGSAVHEFFNAGRLCDRLAGAIAAHVTKWASVRLEYVRVLNLLHILTFIADPDHEPDSWPLRHWEDN